MDNIATGAEQTDWDLYGSAHPGEQLEINAAATSFVLTEDRLVKVEVQLGNAANLLHANGGILAVTMKVTSVDTGDELFMPQVQMNLAAGDQMARISVPSFWAKLGDTIKVFAKSTNANDTSVGGKVWIYDIQPGGSGGGTATEAKQDLILEDIVDMKGTSFVKNTDSLKTIKDTVDGIVSSTPVNIDHSSTAVSRSS